MLNSMIKELNEILFLDIETAPLCRNIDEVDEPLRELFLEKKKPKNKSKSRKALKEEDSDVDEDKAEEEAFGGTGLQAEYGKVICVSLGRFDGGITDEHLKVHSVAYDDERKLLLELAEILNRSKNYKLCAHNGKVFDFPFLGKRFVINQIPLPSQLNIMGKKPWEVPHIDTMEMWAFGAKSNNSVALKLLCAVFGIPSPKDDIDGADVASVFYNDNDLPRIVTYCEKDVRVLAKVYKKMAGFWE